MHERRIDLGAVELVVDEAEPAAADGTVAGNLLLVHGFTGDRADFADWVDLLAAEGWHVVAPALRGHGTSDQPAELSDYSLGLFAGDVVTLADRLGWDRFVLLGHSLGGMIAQVAALRAPERLTGLILMDTSHGPPDLDRGLAELAVSVIHDGGMPALLAAQKALAGEGPLGTPAYERLLRERPGYGEFGDSKLLAASPVMYEAIVAAIFDQADRLDALRSLAVPTLVIVGDEDQPFLADMRRIADAMPAAELVVVPDAGHSPQFENPAAWGAAIRGFLSGSCRGTAGG